MTVENKILVELPFSGFYESLHNDQIDRAMQDLFMNDDCTVDDEKLDQALYSTNFEPIRNDYAQAYVKRFSELVGYDLEFESLTSPKFYNYSTDRIFAYIDKLDLYKAFQSITLDQLSDAIKEVGTSGSGYHAHYSPDLHEWLETPIHNWEACQLEIILNLKAQNEISAFDSLECRLINDGLSEDCQNIVANHAITGE